MPSHIPVLPKQVLEQLRPERGGLFIDATLGLGGHTELMLEAGASRIIGIDQDTEALRMANERLGEKIEYAWGNFGDIAELMKSRGVKPGTVDGILMDIGVSSYQIDDAERGFSFMNDGPLDMRMDEQNTVTASTIVNTWPEPKLAMMIFNYGEERLSRKIARVICERRKKEHFYTTKDLADTITELYPPALRHRHPHPATRTFQALRIEVNRELDVLKDGIEGALPLLAPGGVLAIISFHSLEDRIVKHAFRAATEDGFEILTKKPLEADFEETKANSRSRSAKLRAIRRQIS